LEIWRNIQSRRKRIWEYYDRELRDWAVSEGVSQPVVPPHCDSAYHMYYLLLPSERNRLGLINHLKGRGIMSVFHYVPLHLSTMGRKFGSREGDCPVTEDVSDRLLRLPFYNEMSEAEQSRVVAAIREYKIL